MPGGFHYAICCCHVQFLSEQCTIQYLECGNDLGQQVSSGEVDKLNVVDVFWYLVSDGPHRASVFWVHLAFCVLPTHTGMGTHAL